MATLAFFLHPGQLPGADTSKLVLYAAFICMEKQSVFEHHPIICDRVRLFTYISGSQVETQNSLLQIISKLLYMQWSDYP